MILISSSTRVYNLRVALIKNAGMLINTDFNNPWAVIDRPSKCTCCCCEHAELSVTQGDERIGGVAESVTCCDPYHFIYSKQDKAKWKVWADGNQRPISFCSCTPPGVGECNFGIYSADEMSMNKSNAKGNIKKLYMGAADLVGSTTIFEVDFPESMTAIEKFIIIGNTIQIDYEYFDYGFSLRSKH
jgi:hypothetical protein